jgi:hypothetical protein
LRVCFSLFDWLSLFSTYLFSIASYSGTFKKYSCLLIPCAVALENTCKLTMTYDDYEAVVGGDGSDDNFYIMLDINLLNNKESRSKYLKSYLNKKSA